MESARALEALLIAGAVLSLPSTEAVQAGSPAVSPSNQASKAVRTGVAGGAAATVPQATITLPSGANQQQAKGAPGDSKSKAGAKPSAARKSSARTPVMIPPPPPNTPSLLSPDFMGRPSIELLDEPALKEQQKKLRRELDDYKFELSEQTRVTTEKQNRAKQFVELLEEGVVSKREFESSQRESALAERELEKKKEAVAETESVLSQVNSKLAKIDADKLDRAAKAKRTKPLKSSSIPGKRK